VRESFPLSTVAAFDVMPPKAAGCWWTSRPTSSPTSTTCAVRCVPRQLQLDAIRAPCTCRTPKRSRGTELEASLTFTSDQPGFAIRTHAPDGRFVTLRQHLSLVQLPDSGFQPRSSIHASGSST